MGKLGHKLFTRASVIALAFVVAVSSLSTVLPFLSTDQASAASTVVYDSLADVSSPTNYASLGYQATQTSEFGDYVHLAGTNRILDNVTVIMSNWAKYADYSSDARYLANDSTWSHPVTLKVYSNHLNASGVPDTLLASVTQDVSIPWRPASDPTCGDTSNGKGWKVDDTCYDFSGIAFPASFDLSSLHAALTNDVIVGVSYNTQTYGSAPVGVTGPYNSLNVAIPDSQTVSVGSDDSASNVFWNTATAAWYTDGGAGGVGTFRQDTNWSPNGTVAMQITAHQVAAPSNLRFVNGATAVSNGSTFHTQASVNSIQLKWDASETNTYRTQITYPDHSSTLAYTNTQNLWLGQTAYTNYQLGQKGDGEYTYTVQGRNTATGQWSAWSETVHLYYDTHSPVATFSATPPTLVNGNFHVTGTASDNVQLQNVFFDVRDGASWVAGCVSGTTNLVYSTDRTSATIECDINTTNLIEGHTYVLRIHASDYAGYGGGQQQNFMIDRTAPTTPEVTAPTDGQYINGSSTPNTWTASTDANGIVQYQVKYELSTGTSYRYTTGTSRTQTFSGSYQGPITISVRAQDGAGNWSEYGTPVTYTYDSVAPAITITNPLDGSTVGHNALVNITADLGDAASYKLLINGTEVSAATLPYDWDTTGLASGDYIITVEGKDAAGNTGTATATVTVDNTAPTFTVNPYNGTDTTPTLTGTTESADDTVTVDGNDATVSSTANVGGTYDWSYTLPAQTPGTYTISVVSTDSLGNVAPTKTATVTVINESNLNNPDGTTETPVQTVTITPNNDQAVLGEQTDTPSDEATQNSVALNNTNDNTDEAVKAASDTKNQGTIFGLAWYWWLLILAVIAAIIAWIVAAYRKRAPQE